jgi:hypothetical protein
MKNFDGQNWRITVENFTNSVKTMLYNNQVLKLWSQKQSFSNLNDSLKKYI